MSEVPDKWTLSIQNAQEQIQFADQFPWREELSELAEECAPEGWALSSRKNRHGVETWRYMRLDTSTCTYLCVEIEAVLELSHIDKFVQFSIIAARSGVQIARTPFSDYVDPTRFGELVEPLQQVFAEAEEILYND